MSPACCVEVAMSDAGTSERDSSGLDQCDNSVQSCLHSGSFLKVEPAGFGMD